MKYLMIVLLSILIFSGCTPKEPEIKVEYRDRVIKAPIYEFQIVDIDGAVIAIKSAWYQSPTMKVGVSSYIKGKPQYEIRFTAGDVANICGGYMEQEKVFYRTIIDEFYVKQIKDYRKINGVENGKN